MDDRATRRAASQRRLARYAAALAWLSLPALIRITLTIPVHAPLDRNEGWSGYITQRVADGRPLYPHPPRFFTNNYPPLSFYALGHFDVADRIAQGRAVSLIAFAAWVVLVGVTARRLGSSPAEAAFAAALFAALMLSLSGYVGINDPQLLGHVPQAMAMTLLVQRPRTTARVLLAAVLLSAGVFVKHSLFMLPLALVVWLLRVDRRAGGELLAAGGLFAVAGTALCIWQFGPGFLPQMAMPRDYVVRDALRAGILWPLRTIVFLTLAAMLARRGARDEAAAFVSTYAFVAAALGLPLVGGAGVDWNMLFDANVACCLAAAVAIDRLGSERHQMIAARASLVLPALGAILSSQPAWLSPSYWLAPRAAESVDADRDIAFIRSHDGPALCADLALCLRAGKAEEVDVFGFEQLGKRDRAHFDELARLVDARYYAVIHMGRVPIRFGPDFDAAIARRYVLAYQSSLGPILVRGDRSAAVPDHHHRDVVARRGVAAKRPDVGEQRVQRLLR